MAIQQRERVSGRPIIAYPDGYLRDSEGYQISIPGVTERVPINVTVGRKAIIPAIYLSVTRPFSTGHEQHDKNIKKAYGKTYKGDPEKFLLDNPVQVVAVPRSLSMPRESLPEADQEAWDLIILDGNGRARWAAKYGISNVYCNVQTIEEVTRNFERKFPHVTAEMVAKALKNEADTADASYLAAREEPVGCRRGRVNYATPRSFSSQELANLIPGFFPLTRPTN